MMRMVERVDLAGGELFSVCDARAVEVSVARGRAWVTIAQDSRDFFPSAGQSVAIPAGQRAVVEALDGAEVTLSVRQGWLARALAGGLMALAVGALALRQRLGRLHSPAWRSSAPHSVAACRDGGC